MSDSHSAEKKTKTRPSENQTTIWLPRQKNESQRDTQRERCKSTQRDQRDANWHREIANSYSYLGITWVEILISSQKTR